MQWQPGDENIISKRRARSRETDLVVGRDRGLLHLIAGLQLGHVVGQVDVHVLDDLRPALVGHAQMNHIVPGRRRSGPPRVVVVVVRGLLVQRRRVLLRRVLLRTEPAVLVVHVLLDLLRYERAQAVRLGRRHEVHLAGDGPAPDGPGRRAQHAAGAAAGAVLLHPIVDAAAAAALVVLLVQVKLVRGGPQQRPVVDGRAQMVLQPDVVMVVWRRGLGLAAGHQLQLAEMLVHRLPGVLVLVPVHARVLVTVRRLARVPVLVLHFAVVLVVVYHFAHVDQRYALAGQLVRVDVVHVVRHLFGYHDDDPVVPAQNQVVYRVIT